VATPGPSNQLTPQADVMPPASDPPIQEVQVVEIPDDIPQVEIPPIPEVQIFAEQTRPTVTISEDAKSAFNIVSGQSMFNNMVKLRKHAHKLSLRQYSSETDFPQFFAPKNNATLTGGGGSAAATGFFQPKKVVNELAPPLIALCEGTSQLITGIGELKRQLEPIMTHELSATVTKIVNGSNLAHEATNYLGRLRMVKVLAMRDTVIAQSPDVSRDRLTEAPLGDSVLFEGVQTQTLRDEQFRARTLSGGQAAQYSTRPFRDVPPSRGRLPKKSAQFTRGRGNRSSQGPSEFQSPRGPYTEFSTPRGQYSPSSSGPTRAGRRGHKQPRLH